jgi:hypothetical protein
MLGGIEEMNFAITMFIIRSDGGTLVCFLPINAESFADYALMLSMIKLLGYENIELTCGLKLLLPSINTPIGERLVELFLLELTLQKSSLHHICKYVKVAPEEAVDPADRTFFHSSYGTIEVIMEDGLSLVSAHCRLLGLRAEQA